MAVVAFDWSSRAHPNDAIVLAGVQSVPPGAMICSVAFLMPVSETERRGDASDTWVVECSVSPSPSLASQLPVTVGLRCTAIFELGADRQRYHSDNDLSAVVLAPAADGRFVFADRAQKPDPRCRRSGLLGLGRLLRVPL